MRLERGSWRRVVRRASPVASAIVRASPAASRSSARRRREIRVARASSHAGQLVQRARPRCTASTGRSTDRRTGGRCAVRRRHRCHGMASRGACGAPSGHARTSYATSPAKPRRSRPSRARSWAASRCGHGPALQRARRSVRRGTPGASAAHVRAIGTRPATPRETATERPPACVRATRRRRPARPRAPARSARCLRQKLRLLGQAAQRVCDDIRADAAEQQHAARARRT